MPHIGAAGWFTQHIWEGIEVTAGRLARLVRPGRASHRTPRTVAARHGIPILGDRVPSISPARALVLGMLGRRQMYGHQVLWEAGPRERTE